MPVMFFIDAIVVLLFVYWVTLMLHELGVPIYKVEDINLAKAFLIPFYYWFKKTPNNKKPRTTKTNTNENKQTT